MVGAQHSNDDDASLAGYHAIAEHYPEAAAHNYLIGQIEEAQRLAKADACFLAANQDVDPAEAITDNRQASTS